MDLTIGIDKDTLAELNEEFLGNLTGFLLDAGLSFNAAAFVLQTIVTAIDQTNEMLSE